jgi:hypothetical protein
LLDSTSFSDVTDNKLRLVTLAVDDIKNGVGSSSVGTSEDEGVDPEVSDETEVGLEFDTWCKFLPILAISKVSLFFDC